ncbi:hypothetical protein KJ567_07310, partial [Candidatus Bipolaricaulota bacterium]|nr:hypothetical protein [Candidatus Bipolaricaulota bacterium]
MASARRPSKAHRLQRDTAWARFIRELKKRPALLTLGGLALGAVAIGVCLLLLHFVIQPFSRPEAKGYTTFKGENFRLWYDDESANMEDHAAMQEALEREYAGLIALLGVSEAVFEAPIDVFVHDSIPAMQMSIMRRKSSTAGAVFDYPFDVLADQSPRRALAEVMLFYEWGGCFTSALYAGTLEYITAPEVPYLSIVKAAPDEMTHSLEELAVMESRGEFGTTMYRELSGPMASAAIVDLASFQVLLRVPQSLAEAQEQRFPVLEMASLVEFLVEQRGGMSRLATAWGPGQLSSVLQRADAASSLDELNALWQEAIET